MAEAATIKLTKSSDDPEADRDAAVAAARTARLLEAGVPEYCLSRMNDALYFEPEDIYFEDDEERMVALVGFSVAKAREVRVAVEQYMNAATHSLAPMKERPLSEPEIRDAKQFDDENDGSNVPAAVAPSEDAAVVEEASA